MRPLPLTSVCMHLLTRHPLSTELRANGHGRLHRHSDMVAAALQAAVVAAGEEEQKRGGEAESGDKGDEQQEQREEGDGEEEGEEQQEEDQSGEEEEEVGVLGEEGEDDEDDEEEGSGDQDANTDAVRSRRLAELMRKVGGIVGDWKPTSSSLPARVPRRSPPPASVRDRGSKQGPDSGRVACMPAPRRGSRTTTPSTDSFRSTNIDNSASIGSQLALSSGEGSVLSEPDSDSSGYGVLSSFGADRAAARQQERKKFAEESKQETPRQRKRRQITWTSFSRVLGGGDIEKRLGRELEAVLHRRSPQLGRPYVELMEAGMRHLGAHRSMLRSGDMTPVRFWEVVVHLRRQGAGSPPSRANSLPQQQHSTRHRSSRSPEVVAVMVVDEDLPPALERAESITVPDDPEDMPPALERAGSAGSGGGDTAAQRVPQSKALGSGGKRKPGSTTSFLDNVLEDITKRSADAAKRLKRDKDESDRRRTGFL